MKKISKKILALTLSTTCILTSANIVSFNMPESAHNFYTTIKAHAAVNTDTNKFLPPDDRNPDQLFAGYVEQVFHSKNNTASLKNLNAASKLSKQNRLVYHALKTEIEKVAAGTRASTEFSVSVSDLLDKTTYSAAELGLSSSSTKEEIAYAIEHKIFGFSLYAVMNALFMDCPYDLYWHSRTASISQSGPEYMLDADNGISFAQGAKIIFQFPVDSAYAVSTYTTDLSKTSAATTAAANARAIVAAAAGKSDYEKLVFYRQQICELTSYNDAAAAGAVSDTSPWQMIYVFDNNPSTNVVCEGYAKAFQYLCDETVFSNANIYCYTVDGLVRSSIGAAAHMWNIVHMGSSGNYLVDVTNCDTGSIGSDDKLFLTGFTSGSIQNGYTIQIPAETRTEGNMTYTRPEISVLYQYSDDMNNIYTTNELTLTQGGILRPELIRDDEAHSHAYETSFFWSNDHSRCSAFIICRTNPAHAVSDLSCNVSSQVQVPATCSANGTAIYTARVSYEGTEYMDTIQGIIDIDPLNHSGKTHIQNAIAATATRDGYTGDTYCSDCGTLIARGSVIPAAKTPDNIPDSDPNNTPDNSSGNTQGNAGNSSGNNSGNAGNASGNTGNSSGNTSDNAGNSSGSASGNTDSTSDRSDDASDENILDTISAQKTTARIKKGKSIQFRLSSSLDMKKVKKITYKTSKKSVAKVSKKGKITGKKAGTATIKAAITLKNGMKKTVSMKIKVQN